MTSVSPLLRRVQTLILDSLPQMQAMRYDITWKPDGSPVTAADLFLEHEISALLRRELPGLRCRANS
ncbi:hypothetical protein [Paenirhodobacter sp.]|uniref:hypothetical protein n=1 Tax=Paenirhodobacter sp. TaxID=1965326 RepID=UPI003B41B178